MDEGFGLMEEEDIGRSLLTPFGELILNNDQYFEDVFTIWLLHSHIVKKIDEATSWYMFFNRMDVEDYEKEQIQQILYREIEKYALRTDISSNSVKNDLDVILNMYSKSKVASDPEDKNVSPFTQLQN